MSIRRPAFSFDTSQPLIDVPTARALRRRLRKLNVPVPLRSEGRTAQDVERAAIVRLLSTLHLEGTTPPTRLVQGDRPDLVLTVGARTIGIEHTEAIPANVAHATALREQGHGPKIYFTPRALPTDSKKSRKELLQEIAADEPHDGWAGDSAEREWAGGMLAGIQRKERTAAKPGFRRFPENWLLIYDNWPLPNIDPAVALSHLQDQLDQDVFDCFDTIHVERPHRVGNHEARIYDSDHPKIGSTPAATLASTEVMQKCSHRERELQSSQDYQRRGHIYVMFFALSTLNE